MKTQDFGCSSFCVTDTEGHAIMGRNYDFHADTSALMVCCAPKDGYKSVAMAALDNVHVQEISSTRDKLATLASPYICLDGMNEKGVSISILMVDSEPVAQATEKPDIFSTLAIRLVLDRTATTQEAVDMLRSYDMFAVSGGDYHFYVADASGDARILEYDCDSDTRELVDTPVRTTTNFYQLYIDRVLPNQRNGSYGHGKERYDRIEEILTANEGRYTKDIAWEAMAAAAQDGNNEKKSKTQWSAVYDNTQLTADIAIRRNWGDITSYSLTDNTITGRVQRN
jgi:choloylglycine hydrolase